MRALHSCALLAVLALGAACDETIDGQHAVGTAAATDAQIERFVRRLHLDLVAESPTETTLGEARGRVAAAGNTTTIRRALAEELVARPEFASTYIAELENRVYGGDTLAGRYDFVCALTRIRPPCDVCGPPAPGENICQSCACPALVDLAAERAGLATAGADLAAGASTSSIERRYVDANGFQALSGGAAGVATTLIQAILGRTPQADELDNAAAMINGAIVPNSPAGLLYHRHGASYADLLDIIFSDEIYREAMVGAAFARYLGRPPTPPELRHFTTMIDPDEPDLRPVILAIASSREYFQP